MTTEYKWEILSMDVIPEENGKKNVVQVIHWRRHAKNDSGSETYVFDATAIEYDPKGTFVEYKKLDPEQVSSWLSSVLGASRVSELDAGLNEKLQKLANQNSNTNLPWR